MYYKIENKECEVYKKLFALRILELQITEDNIAAIEEKTGLKWESFVGQSGQQNLRRTNQYYGFKFTEPEKVDLKIWQPYKENKEFFVPNKRTKLGREMAEFLLNELKGSRYSAVWDILNLKHIGRFTFPFVEICGDLIIVYLDQKQVPKDENLIEITSVEADKILNA
jgi:hypothetical protein